MGITKKILRKLSSSVSVVSGRSKPAADRDDACSNNQQDDPKKNYLLVRLGGMAALGSIVHEFCHRVTEDPSLQTFFRGVDPRALSAHQKRFFTMAFTAINYEKAEETIRTTHTRLFSMGLSEVHFDIFVNHLSQTLKDRGFGDAIIEEVTAVVAPLREVFRDSSLEYTTSQTKNTEPQP